VRAAVETLGQRRAWKAIAALPLPLVDGTAKSDSIKWKPVAPAMASQVTLI